MKVAVFYFICLTFFAPLAFAEKASEIISASAKKSTVEESIQYVENQIDSVENLSEKRALYIFLGTIYEQLGIYDFARENYVAAAGIAAGNAEGTVKKSNEQLVLDAVRCCLSLGDFKLADSYLNSSIKNSENSEIQAYSTLYSQWSALCKAQNNSEIAETVIMLEAYTKRSSLSVVHPQMILTLWYITGQEKWATVLKTQYANSAEAAVVSGKIQLLPTPFWFLVPRTGVLQPEIAGETIELEHSAETKAEKKSVPVTVLNSNDSNDSTSEKPLYLQLGLFREKSNAQGLVEKLKEKGFSARILPEKRPSGTTYYIVAIDDTSDKTANELRSAGFECYPVF